MNVKIIASTQVHREHLEYLMKEAKSDEDKDFLTNIQDPEALMIYCARVSSPDQKNPEYSKLLNYCAKHSHWSVFEQVDVTFEIETSMPIAAQILRHKSLVFQQFSARYSVSDLGFEIYGARRQDPKNRQNSIDDMQQVDIDWFKSVQENIQEIANMYYKEALKKGIAKEQARFLLPQSCKTRMFAKGSIRSWIHYVNVRADKSSQKEHRDVAEAIKKLMCQHFPVTAKAVGWIE